MKNENNTKNNLSTFIKGTHSLYSVIKIKRVFISLVLLYSVPHMSTKLKIVSMFKRNAYRLFPCFNKETIVSTYAI